MRQYAPCLVGDTTSLMLALKNYGEALTALRAAHKAVQKLAPSQDHYPKGDGPNCYRVAVIQHDHRVQRLQEVILELMNIAEQVAAQ